MFNDNFLNFLAEYRITLKIEINGLDPKMVNLDFIKYRNGYKDTCRIKISKEHFLETDHDANTWISNDIIWRVKKEFEDLMKGEKR